MSLLPVGIGSAEAGGYQIERSLRFNSADSAYLNRTPGSAGNRRTWTWSAWVKLTVTADARLFAARVDNNNRFVIVYTSSQSNLQVSNVVSGTSTVWTATNALLRDPSAWYHFVVAFDSTQATATNRLKVYINGAEQTFSTDNRSSITQNYDGYVNNNIEHYIGSATGSNYADCYLTEINFIDGQALTPSSFGETDTDTGVWKPKAYSGSYGTNGFYLKFADNSGTTSTTLGKDSSGNGNNWTPNNFSVTAGAGNDSLVDTPTNYGTDTGVGGEVRGNYCTWNPLDKNTNLNTVNGNLDVSASNGSWIAAGSTVALAGKIYAETTWTTAGNGFSAQFGLRQSDLANISAVNPTDTATAWSAYWDTAGTRGTRTNSSITNNVGSAAVNDVYQVAFDADTGNLWLGYNNNWHGGGNPSTGTSPTYSGLTNAAGYRFFCATNYGTSTGAFVSNFGQRPFAYTAPSGFKALCTQNLPEPTIKDGGDYFNTVTYTGTLTDGQGTGATQSITGVGFQPDFLWLKNRTNANQHLLVDAVRTVTNYRYLNSSDTGAETTVNSNGAISALNADGFTVENGNDSSAKANLVGRDGWNYVAWNWKANGAGSSNTAGTITSTVSVNTTSGFSIVTWTANGSNADSVGHGLGVTPKLVIYKLRNTSGPWEVWTTAIDGSNDQLYLHLTGAKQDISATYGNLTSTTIPNWGNVNTNTMVAYCFAPVAGYSAFGSYTGNGSADGTFVYTGFRPAYILFKRTNGTGYWWVYDIARDTYNQMISVLNPNVSDAEASNAVYAIDGLSNGFKLRSTGSERNGSGDTYVYMAFASNPFRYSLAA